MTEQQHEGGPRDLTAAYALDAIDAQERALVEALMATDADAKAEVDAFRGVVARFTADEQPPSELKAAVLAHIASLPDDGVGVASNSARDHGKDNAVGEHDFGARAGRGRSRRWAITAIAALSVVGIGALSTVVVTTHQNNVAMEADAAMVAQMIADPDAKLMTEQITGGGELHALAAAGSVMVSTTGMAELDASKDYQLWMTDGDKTSSAGILHPRDGSASMMVSGAAGMTISVTVEPAGGSAAPTAEPMVVVAT